MTPTSLVLSIVYVALLASASADQNQNQNVQNSRIDGGASKNELCTLSGFDWIRNKVLGVVDAFLFDERSGRSSDVEGRKHHNKIKIKKKKLSKYIFPMLLGMMMIKSVMIPLVLKALAIMSGKALLLSVLSLILSAIVGLKSIAYGSHSGHGRIDTHTKYRRKNYANDEESFEDEPFRYYAERRRRRKR